ncbi:hypothetical protein PT974_02385 [Cladobotryum mycophilum]|uniref:Uncharacterized protein n=1 Tax=Cladobotryum mycophilum TaxID=491253 RepID=A0ABR0SZ39_9HYPO
MRKVAKCILGEDLEEFAFYRFIIDPSSYDGTLRAAAFDLEDPEARRGPWNSIKGWIAYLLEDALECPDKEWDRCVGVTISLVAHAHLWLQTNIRDLNRTPIPLASRKVISPALLLKALDSIDPTREANPTPVLEKKIRNLPAVNLEPGPWQKDKRVQKWLADLYKYGMRKPEPNDEGEL